MFERVWARRPISPRHVQQDVGPLLGALGRDERAGVDPQRAKIDLREDLARQNDPQQIGGSRWTLHRGLEELVGGFSSSRRIRTRTLAASSGARSEKRARSALRGQVVAAVRRGRAR